MTESDKHARGALLGLAVGDAFGTTLEFKRTPEAPWAPLLEGPHTQVIGGGPFRVDPGQVTDDTMMAACLASSLRAVGGLDQDDLAKRYVAWHEATFDCGSQTGQSLGFLRKGTIPSHSGRAVWESSGRQAAGNGSLMRTAPIGVFFASEHLSSIVTASILDSTMTHFDPRCALACAAYNAAIGKAISADFEDVGAEKMFNVAHDALLMAAGYFIGSFPEYTEEVENALGDLQIDLGFAEDADPRLYESSLHIQNMQGFVRVGFRLAFWELAHASDYRSALIDTVNRGGDADTNGAIVGGLLGARFGEDSIPEEWKATVMNCDPPGPFGKSGVLHPLRLLEMLDPPENP